MTIEQMKKSLDIFSRYDKKGAEGWWCSGAAHDIVWSSYNGDDIPPKSDDGKLLKSLGWHLSTEYECWSMFT